MKKTNRINFDNVRINDIIEFNNNFKKNDIRIYQVVSIDEKIYNDEYNEYYKLIQCELISVPNEDINIYKKAGLIKNNIIFYEYGKEFLTLEGYKII